MNEVTGVKLLKMIRYATSLLVVTVVIVIIFSFYNSSSGVACAVETANSDFGITTSPDSKFLVAPNMAPGDTASADLTVNNVGQVDFLYDLSAINQSVDTLVYDVLDLQIRDSQGLVIYDGKLKELRNAVCGIIGPGNSEVLKFQVSFPIECGNEYQGKGADVTFTLNASEHPSQIFHGEIVWDPPLEKNDVHVRRGVIMPIKFHLIKEGVFDTVKRGIDLVISGVNDAGEPVEYTFSVTDGTLEWEEHGLNKPHYALKFDAEKYPVKFDTYYTATAKYGEQVLGSTQFKSGK